MGRIVTGCTLTTGGVAAITPGTVIDPTTTGKHLVAATIIATTVTGNISATGNVIMATVASNGTTTGSIHGGVDVCGYRLARIPLPPRICGICLR